MSVDEVTNPVALTQTESNTARKKKAKAEAAAAVKGNTDTGLETPLEESAPAINGEASDNESAYIKELQKYESHLLQAVELAQSCC